MAMSPRQFYRKLKDISGMSPSDLIKNYRMDKAARLLLNDELSIQDVISDVGIASRSYFYKEFTRKFSVTLKTTGNCIRNDFFSFSSFVTSLFFLYSLCAFYNSMYKIISGLFCALNVRLFSFRTFLLMFFTLSVGSTKSC